MKKHKNQESIDLINDNSSIVARPKRKKHTFLKAIVIFIVCLIIIFSALIIAAKVVYDKYGKEYIGLEFTQAISLFGAITKSNKDLKSNYTDKDRNSLETKFEKSLYLSHDSAKIDKILNTFDNKKLNSEDSSILDEIDFDFSKLKNAKAPEILEINEAEAAFLMSKALKKISQSEEGKKFKEKTGMQLHEILTVKRVDIKGKDKDLSMIITLNAFLRKLIGSPKLKGAIDNIPSFLTNKVPDNGILQVTVYPNDETKKSIIGVNRTIGNEKAQCYLNIMLDTVSKNLNKDKGEETSQDIRTMVQKGALDAFKAMGKYLKFEISESDSNKNFLRIYTIQSAIKMIAKKKEINLSEEEKDIIDAIKTISMENEINLENQFKESDLDDFIKQEFVNKMGIPEDKINKQTILTDTAATFKYIDVEKILVNYNDANSPFEINDKVFGALINKQLSNKEIKNVQLIILAVKAIENKMEIYANVGLGDLISSKLEVDINTARGKLIKKFFDELVQDTAMFKITIDLRTMYFDKGADGNYVLSTDFKYNKDDTLTSKRLDNLNKVISLATQTETKLINYNHICLEIDKAVKDAFVKIQEQTGEAVEVKEGKINIASLYTILKERVDKNKNPSSKPNNETFRLMLKNLYKEGFEYPQIEYNKSLNVADKDIKDLELGSIIVEHLNNNYEGFNAKLLACVIAPKNESTSILEKIDNLNTGYNVLTNYVDKDVIILKMEYDLNNIEVNIAPKKIEATVIYDINSENNLILYNSLNKEQKNALEWVLVQTNNNMIDDAEKSINKIIKETLGEENGLKITLNINGNDVNILLSKILKAKKGDRLADLIEGGSTSLKFKNDPANFVKITPENIELNKGYGEIQLDLEVELA